MASTTSQSAILAYRNILRATRIAFYGDWPTMHAAREEARKRFAANRRPTVDTGLRVQEAFDVARILRNNLVQGKARKPEGATSDTAAPGNGEDSASIYELRLHDEIERGDNESIKFSGANGKTKCCSS